MFKRSEGYLTSVDGTRLYFQKWEKPEALGTILITHGQGEHGQCYERMILGLEDVPWNFITWDLRGHGKSDGRRGYVADFNEYCSDFKFVANEVSKADSTVKPLVLFAHSMGGLIQNLSLLDSDFSTKKLNIKSQILSAPLFNLSLPVPAYKSKAAGLLNKLLPKVTLGNEIDPLMVSRDNEVIKSFATDPYRHDKISPRVFLGMNAGFETISTESHKITLPTYLFISDNDPVVSTAAAKMFIDNIKSNPKVLKIYDGGRHELVNDIIRNKVYAYLKAHLITVMELP